MQSHDFLTPFRGKLLIKSKQFKDYVTSNIIDKQSTNNSKCFKTAQCHSEIYKNSFFPRTIINWNHLGDSIVRTDTVDGHSGTNILPSSLPVASTLKGPATYSSRSRSSLPMKVYKANFPTCENTQNGEKQIFLNCVYI